jgi:nucleoside-diphosphate-sugar epimerase
VAEGCAVRVVDNLSTGTLRNLEHLTDRVDVVVGDLTESDVCRSVVQDMDLVFHAAALPSVPRSMKDPWGSYQHNVTATMQLLLASMEHGVRRMVYSSSSSVYGDTPILPKIESMEPLPRSPYAAAKLAGEQFVLGFARAGLLKGVALRYFNVFGPRQDIGSAYAAVIPIFLAAARDGTAASIFGDGKQTRDFTYVENVVEANLLSAFGPDESTNGTVFNVGMGDRISLIQLLGHVSEVTGRHLVAEYGPARDGDVRDSLASLERSKTLLGYSPAVGLIEGLQRTWQWFKVGASAA